MDKNLYEHDIEGIDDMPAHIKTSLTQTNLTFTSLTKAYVWEVAGNLCLNIE